MKKSIIATLQITVMILMIIAGAAIFGQILSFSGATRGLIHYVVDLPLTPIMVLIGMQILLLFMGTFMSLVAIVMITVPIYMPIIYALGFDPIWFGVMMLVNLEMGTTTPPFGLSLYVMKGVAPPDTTMGDIYKAGIPFLVCDAITIALVMAFPMLALWLPNVMR